MATVYITLNNKPVEIKRSSNFEVKLTKEEKEMLYKTQKSKNGSIFFEFKDPYENFREKVKAQIKSGGSYDC